MLTGFDRAFPENTPRHLFTFCTMFFARKRTAEKTNSIKDLKWCVRQSDRDCAPSTIIHARVL